MDIKDLKYFVTVYETSGFLRAAARLHTVQSNVSARIRRLEDRLGQRLFIRLHRGVQATPAGHLLYPSANQLISMINALETQPRQLSNSHDEGETKVVEMCVAAIDHR